MKIAVLGVCEKSNYYKVNSPGCELIFYDKAKDMRTFDFSCPVIAHPPCAQWSRVRNFAHDNPEEKKLAHFCLYAVRLCGGILEHPHGSEFMRDVVGYENCISVNQHWWKFPCQKKTLLYFNRCRPLSFPLNFNAVTKTTYDLDHYSRSKTTLEFNTWLVDCIRQTFTAPIITV